YLIGEAAPQFARSLDGKALYEMSGVLETAVTHAAADAQASEAPHPVVLLSPACASYDQFKDFEQRGDIFRNLVATLPRDPLNTGGVEGPGPKKAVSPIGGSGWPASPFSACGRGPAWG